MIKEAITSLFGTVRERLSNPIFGAFILSWAAINWRILYTILRPLDTAQATIQAVESYATYWLCVFAPVLLACLYVLAYPWAKFGILYLQSIPTQKLRVLQFEWEGRVLNARRKVLQIESDLALIRVRNDLGMEVEKLEAQDRIESMKHERQYQREQQQIQRENARREHEANLEAKRLDRQLQLDEQKLELEHQRRMQEIQLQNQQLRSRQ